MYVVGSATCCQLHVASPANHQPSCCTCALLTALLCRPRSLRSPNDAAVASFLSAMGLTLDDLKARPQLAKKIAAQHIILKSNVRAQEIFADGNVREVNTLAGRPSEVRAAAAWCWMQHCCRCGSSSTEPLCCTACCERCAVCTSRLPLP